MANGWNKFYTHGKVVKVDEEETQKSLEEVSRCPVCGCGSFTLKLKGKYILRTCKNEECLHELAPIK